MKLSLVLALACHVPGAGGQRTPEPTKHPVRVLLIGIDGVSRNLLEPFAAAGTTPHLKALMDEGVRGHLASFWPTRTPQVWTSMITGKMPGQHGIWDHLWNSTLVPKELRRKRKQRVTSKDRRSKALWSILSEHGLRSLVVGWMSSWPAEKVPGATIVAPVELIGDRRQSTIKGSFYRDQEQMVQPESLTERVRSLIVEPKDVKAEELAPYADIPTGKHPLYRLPYLRRYVYGLSWSLARGRSVEAIAVGLFQEARPDVVLAYFQCPDTMGHRFFLFTETHEAVRTRLARFSLPTEHAGELKRRFGSALETCYREVDARVGKLLEAMRTAQTTVLVVSDHGFGRAVKPRADEPYGGEHLDDGIIIAAGASMKATGVIEGARVIDVTPTLLCQLGLPVADDMPGRILTPLCNRGPGNEKSQARIPSYEASPQKRIPYAKGWPPRKGALRPTSAEMPARE